MESEPKIQNQTTSEKPEVIHHIQDNDNNIKHQQVDLDRLNKNKDTLDICSNSQMNTIIPNISINNNLYKEIKNNLNKGNIIKIEVNNKNISELKLASEFIKSKGYKIVFLDDLLNEY